MRYYRNGSKGSEGEYYNEVESKKLKKGVMYYDNGRIRYKGEFYEKFGIIKLENI